MIEASVVFSAGTRYNFSCHRKPDCPASVFMKGALCFGIPTFAEIPILDDGPERHGPAGAGGADCGLDSFGSGTAVFLAAGFRFLSALFLDPVPCILPEPAGTAAGKYGLFTGLVPGQGLVFQTENRLPPAEGL